MKDIEKPLKSAKISEVVDKWDAKYVDIDREDLFELISAANYMNIPSLLDLTGAKVASMIMGKTPEQIRETFNIVDDLSDEEKNQIREENKWLNELPWDDVFPRCECISNQFCIFKGFTNKKKKEE